MDVAQRDHGTTRLGGPLDHPALLPWPEPLGPFRRRLDLDAPQGAMCCHPSVKGMLVRLVIVNDCFETGQSCGSSRWSSVAAATPSSPPRPRDQHHHQHAQGLDHQRPRAPFHLFATSSAALSSAHLRRLCRWVCSRNAASMVAHVPSSRHRAQSSYTVLLGNTSCGSIAL